MYGLLVLFVVEWRNEADEWAGKLPTTKASFIVYEALYKNYWVDDETGERLAEQDPRLQGLTGGGFGGGGFGGGYDGGRFGGGRLGGMPSISHRESPSRYDFFPISHVLWAILFGYLGGRLGCFLVQRRVSQTT